MTDGLSSPRSAPYEHSVERDRDLISGNDLARIRYRRDGVRKWSSFVIYLDEETTFEVVEANAGSLIAMYEGRLRRGERGEL